MIKLLSHLSYVAITSPDVEASVKFYEEQVGLKPAREEGGGVVYECAAKTACFLYPTPNAGSSKASQAFWQVEDVERVVADLQARGVQFEDYDEPGMRTVKHILTAGGAKAAWFRDTEGNIMAVVQDLQD